MNFAVLFAAKKLARFPRVACKEKADPCKFLTVQKFVKEVWVLTWFPIFPSTTPIAGASANEIPFSIQFVQASRWVTTFFFKTSLEQSVTIVQLKPHRNNQHKSLRKYYLCKKDLNQLHLIFSCDKAVNERASLNRRERVIGLFTV